MKNRTLQPIISALEKEIRNDFEVYDDYEAGLGLCEVKIGDVLAWVDESSFYPAKLTICVCHPNERELPNVEAYIADELEKRIDFAQICDEEMRERESIEETNLSLCRSFGWSTSFSH